MKINRLILLSFLALAPGITHAIGTTPPLDIPPGHRQQLNSSLVSGGNVSGSTVSPDSSTTVYIADQDTDDIYELYSVAMEGGSVTKISDTLIPDGDVVHFKISPDSSTVVYVADQDTDGVYELYSVPIRGGVPTKIHPHLHFFGTEGVGDFHISPDSISVLFVADLNPSAEAHAIYQAPINGGGLTPVAGPFAEGREISNFVVSPDGAIVVYRADLGIAGRPGLYSVSIDGGIPVRISGVDAPVGDGVERFDISPDGSTVVYVKESFSTDLYAVPVGGGGPTRINERLFSSRGPFATSDVDSFAISADGSTVVYRADETTDNVDEIYAVPIGGGSPLHLNGSLDSGGDVRGFAISGDSSTVVYSADQDDDNVVELYSVSIAGDDNVRINSNIDKDGDVNTFQISADSSSVIYIADLEDDGVHQLYHVPIGGGTSTQLNRSLVTGGDVLPGLLFSPVPTLHITQDSSTVVYQADQDTDGVLELYAVWIKPEEDGPTLGRSLAEDWQESYFTLRELANPWKKAALWGWEADPDRDGLTNLMEYALDGNPRFASHQFTDGSLMGAALEIEDNLVEVQFPERTDAWIRGLQYELKYSTDMENWLPVPSSGPILRTISPYNPSVPGFQKSVWRWNVAHDRLFIRLRASFITLAPL